MNKHVQAQIKSEVLRLLASNRIRKPPVRVKMIAKNLGVHIRYEPFEDDVSGALFRDTDNTIIGVNSLHPPNRQRVTIAHEIGHLLLHEMKMHVDKGYRIVL